MGYGGVSGCSCTRLSTEDKVTDNTRGCLASHGPCQLFCPPAPAAGISFYLGSFLLPPPPFMLLPMSLSYPSPAIVKYSNRSILREKGFILAYNSRVQAIVMMGKIKAVVLYNKWSH